jgi:hypothetical protein
LLEPAGPHLLRQGQPTSLELLCLAWPPPSQRWIHPRQRRIWGPVGASAGSGSMRPDCGTGAATLGRCSGAREVSARGGHLGERELEERGVVVGEEAAHARPRRGGHGKRRNSPRRRRIHPRRCWIWTPGQDRGSEAAAPSCTPDCESSEFGTRSSFMGRRYEPRASAHLVVDGGGPRLRRRPPVVGRRFHAPPCLVLAPGLDCLRHLCVRDSIRISVGERISSRLLRNGGIGPRGRGIHERRDGTHLAR